MYQALKKKSLRAARPVLALLLAAAVILLILSAGGIAKLIAGPEDFQSASEEDLSTLGTYVSLDASQIIVAFAELTTQDSDGNTQATLETEYLAITSNGKYIAVMDAKEANEDLLSTAMSQSRDYYYTKTRESLDSLGTLTGTVAKLDNDMLGYMTGPIEDYSLPGYEEGGDTELLLIPYQINLGKVGWFSKDITILLFALGLACLAALIVLFVLIQKGFFQKHVKSVLGSDNADDAYEEAEEIGRVRVGRYIWYQKGMQSEVIRPEDLIWGYPAAEPLVTSKYRWPATLYTTDQKELSLSFLSTADVDKFLNRIADQGFPFVKGYSAALAAQFRDHFPAFTALAKEEAEKRKMEKSNQDVEAAPEEAEDIS